MNTLGIQILTLILLTSPDTSGVKLPTLQLGEFVIYGIDTLHLRRTAVSLKPKGIYLPLGPRPELQIDRLLTVKEIKITPLPKKPLTRNPLIGKGYIYISTIPTGSGGLTLSGPVLNSLNVDLGMLGLRTPGHIRNAKERALEGRLKVSYTHPQFDISLASLYRQNYFGYFLIDTTTSGFRQIARLKMKSSVNYSEHLLLKFSVENLSITQQIKNKYRLDKRNLNLLIGGEMESGPLSAFLFNTDVIFRSSRVSNRYTQDILDTSSTALQVSAGIRNLIGKTIFVGELGLSLSDKVTFYPVSTLRVTFPISQYLATGVKLRISRVVDSLYTLSRFLFPENFSIERRTALTIFSDYEFNATKLSLDLMFMERTDATILKKFPQSSPIEEILKTTSFNFFETRVSASIIARLEMVSIFANLRYSLFNPDSTLLPNIVGSISTKINLTRNGFVGINLKVFDRFLYTTAKVNYNWNRVVFFGLGVRNLFDQPDGWVGRDTGGRRELFFELNLIKEVIP